MSSLSKNVYSLYRTQIVPKMKPCPDLTEGRGSEVRPPVESITQLFLYKGNIEKKKAWQMLLVLLRNNFFLLGWEKCARQLSHPPTVEVGRFWQAVWPAEPQSAAESRLDGPWLSQMECIYELLGFGSRLMRVIPNSSRENCAWQPVRRSESGVELVNVCVPSGSA